MIRNNDDPSETLVHGGVGSNKNEPHVIYVMVRNKDGPHVICVMVRNNDEPSETLVRGG